MSGKWKEPFKIAQYCQYDAIQAVQRFGDSKLFHHSVTDTMICAFKTEESELEHSFDAKNAVRLQDLVSTKRIGGGGGATSRYRR